MTITKNRREYEVFRSVYVRVWDRRRGQGGWLNKVSFVGARKNLWLEFQAPYPFSDLQMLHHTESFVMRSLVFDATRGLPHERYSLNNADRCLYSLSFTSSCRFVRTWDSFGKCFWQYSSPSWDRKLIIVRRHPLLEHCIQDKRDELFVPGGGLALKRGV